MDDQVITKAKHLGQLLAKSPLDIELKITILENLSKMPEKYLDALIVSLENEAKGIEILLKEADVFLKTQDDDWAKVEADQTALADKMTEEIIGEVVKEDQINAVKANIVSSL
ncbi:MAG: hypothetical protein WCV68_00105 [Candidatus Paceibacterota bacterium]|jgi:hypothetical protein